VEPLPCSTAALVACASNSKDVEGAVVSPRWDGVCWYAYGVCSSVASVHGVHGE
jgi:hypothetical protein